MIEVEVIDRQCLTPRQADVLKGVVEGKPNKLIARELAISLRAVEAEFTQIVERMNLRQAVINARCAMIVQAIHRGMVRLSGTALVWWLMLSAVSADDPARRIKSAKSSRPAAARSMRKADYA